MTPLEKALAGTRKITTGEKLVMSKMVPDQDICSAALQRLVGKTPRVAPVLSRLADDGYVRVTRKEGNTYFWALNRERTIGRKGPRIARRRAKRADPPLRALRTELEVQRLAIVRMEAALAKLEEDLKVVEQLKEVLKS